MSSIFQGIDNEPPGIVFFSIATGPIPATASRMRSLSFAVSDERPFEVYASEGQPVASTSNGLSFDQYGRVRVSTIFPTEVVQSTGGLSMTPAQELIVVGSVDVIHQGVGITTQGYIAVSEEDVTFWALLQSSLFPIGGDGDYSKAASFSRDDRKTGIDYQGKQFTAKANESVFEGSRRVENLITASEDMTNAAWVTARGAVVDSATQATFDGTADGTIAQTVTITDDGSGAGGRTFIVSADIAIVSGAASSDSAINIWCGGNAITNASQNIGSALTTTPQRFSVTASTDAAGTTVDSFVYSDDAITLSITNWQLEEVTGQLNQNPGEYVSTGVGTGAELVTNGTFDTDTTGWTAILGSTLSVDSARLKNTNDGTGSGFGGASQAVTTVVGKDYVASVDLTLGTASTGSLRVGTTISGAELGNSGAISSNQTISVPFTATTTTSYVIPLNTDSGANEYNFYDNISIKEADHGANRDGVQYFTYHNANTVSSGVVTEATGAPINSSTSQFVELDGVSGTYVSTPDSAANTSTTETLDIRWFGAADDWTPATGGYFASKWLSTGNNRAWRFLLSTSTGTIKFSNSTDGTGTDAEATSTEALGFADGSFHGVRVVVDYGGSTVTFYTSDDLPTASNTTWTQLGDQVAFADSTTYAADTVLEIGSIGNGAINPFSGKVTRSIGYKGSETMFDFNANDYVAGQTFESSATSEVWTLQGAAKVFTPLSRSIDVDGTADGWTSPDSAAASITGDIFLAGWGAPDDWTDAANPYIMGKYEATGSQRGYGLGITSGGVIRVITSSDGITPVSSTSDTATGFTDGTPHGIAASIDLSANTATFYTAPASDAFKPHNKVTWTQLGEPVAHVQTAIFDSTALVTVGGIANAVTTNEWTGRIMRAYAIASTDPTVAPAWDFDARALTPGVTTGTMSTGEVWTAVGNGTIEAQIPSKWDASGPYGINIEGARTNTLLQSNNFATTWTNTNSVDAQNYAVGSDGKKTFQRIVDDSATGTGLVYMQQNSVAATSGDNTYSTEVKADQLSWVWVTTGNYDAGADGTSYFNLSSGAWGTVSANHTPHVESLGNGIYRIAVTFSTTTDLTGSVFIGVAAADNNQTVDLDGTSSILAGNGQLEAGSFPSTYIPTTTVAVTRNADLLTYSAVGNADTFPMTASVDVVGTNYAETNTFLSISNSTINERIEFAATSSFKPYFVVTDGGVTQAAITGTSAQVQGATYSLTGIVNSNDFELYQDGKTTGIPDTSGTTPTVTTIRIGVRYDNTRHAETNIRNVKIWDARLTSAEIADL